MSCSACGKSRDRFWEVSLKGTDGAVHGSVQLCSLMCMVQWAQAQMVNRGIGAFEKVKEIISFFKG